MTNAFALIRKALAHGGVVGGRIETCCRRARPTCRSMNRCTVGHFVALLPKTVRDGSSTRRNSAQSRRCQLSRNQCVRTLNRAIEMRSAMTNRDAGDAAMQHRQQGEEKSATAQLGKEKERRAAHGGALALAQTDTAAPRRHAGREKGSQGARQRGMEQLKLTATRQAGTLHIAPQIREGIQESAAHASDAREVTIPRESLQLAIVTSSRGQAESAAGRQLLYRAGELASLHRDQGRRYPIGERDRKEKKKICR